VSSASLAADFRFDLEQSIGTIFGSDLDKLLAVHVAAVYFVKSTRRVAAPADNRGSGENIVQERSGFGAVKYASARLWFQTNKHSPSVY
jgi:hypothetical protein